MTFKFLVKLNEEQVESIVKGQDLKFNQYGGAIGIVEKADSNGIIFKFIEKSDLFIETIKKYPDFIKPYKKKIG